MARDSVEIPLQSASRKTSGLAVIAFVLGVASLAISAGIAAVVLGVLSLRHIRRSGQVVKGRGLAKAAIVLPILTLLFAAVNRAHNVPPEVWCRTNLSGLGAAMLLYANAHDDQLPTPSRWCDLLGSVGAIEPDTFRCPATLRTYAQHLYPLERFLYRRYRSAGRQRGPCDYAMNEDATSVSAPADLVLCYEARSGWNQSGGPELLTTDNHEGRGCNIVFLDTHVEFVPAEKLGQLKWRPPD